MAALVLSSLVEYLRVFVWPSIHPSISPVTPTYMHEMNSDLDLSLCTSL